MIRRILYFGDQGLINVDGSHGAAQESSDTVGGTNCAGCDKGYRATFRPELTASGSLPCDVLRGCGVREGPDSDKTSGSILTAIAVCYVRT